MPTDVNDERTYVSIGEMNISENLRGILRVPSNHIYLARMSIILYVSFSFPVICRHDFDIFP